MTDDTEAPLVELIERRLVTENGRFYIYFDHVRTKDGYAVPNYLVVKPKLAAEQLASGVCVLPIKDGKVGLVRLFRHAVTALVWEMPRGFVEPSESILNSAQRELIEETGLICDEANWLHLGTVLPEAGVFQARVHLYAALDCTISELAPQDEIGHVGFQWFGMREIDALIESSQLEDASTISALYKLKMLRPGVLI